MEKTSLIFPQHLMGFSGLRLELVQRMEMFLNANVTPHVREFGSIGASGDLTPMACITGNLIGLDKCLTVDFDGREADALTALERLGLPRLKLNPKEGLAMINGTSVMSGIAANCIYDARLLLALAMDQLRYYLWLLAKHLDVQITQLVSPAFNNGLPASLIGNQERKVNMELKGLQINGNSIMPLLSFFGNSLVDRFPAHAEQFNQNINSLDLGSGRLARQAIEAFYQYMAVVLMFGVQAADLRTQRVAGHYDARQCLSPATLPLYEAVREVVAIVPSPTQPYIRNDHEQVLSVPIRQIADHTAGIGRIPRSVENVLTAWTSQFEN